MQISSSLLPARPLGTGDWVRDVLRDAILNGRLKPGERIIEAKLARELEVGISPVREGIQKLHHLGLVSDGPGRGTYVTKLSSTDVHQIYRLRAELEALSVQYALAIPDRPGLGRLQEWANAMIESAACKDYQRFFECDIEFHNQVCRMAGDPYLEKCLDGLTTPLFAFVLIQLKQEPMLFDFPALAGRHQDIVDLFRLEDPVQAGGEMRRIMHGFRRTVLETLYSVTTEGNLL
ncbi:MAG: GntR family transcriptional regulator [Candidatus Solibacter usitatus]|nr:GntR family transcriptional regulator [Candidatus Solibacter usitatus]